MPNSNRFQDPCCSRGLSRRELLAGGSALLGASLLHSATFAATAASGPLRIGMVLALTGRVASAYAPLYVGARIAAEEINAAGGIMGRKVEFVEGDDEGTPAREAPVIHSLLEKGIDVLLGPIGTSPVLASLSVTTPARMIQAGGATAEEVANGVKYPYNYQFSYNSSHQARVTVEFITTKLSSKKIGVLQETFAQSEAIANSTIAGLKDHQIAPVGYEVFPTNASDAKSYLRNLQRAGTEVLVLSTSLPSSTLLVFNGLRGLGWYPEIIGYTGFFSDSLLEILPPEAMAKVYIAYLKNFSYAAGGAPPERQVQYVKKLLGYAETKGQEPNAASWAYYDAMHAFKWAIEKANGTDPEKLKSVLDSMTDFPGMLGKMSFTAENHSALGPDALVMCKFDSARAPQAMGAFRERVG
jgi:branched-chain amino acid transport system substrate-binding protein